MIEQILDHRHGESGQYQRWLSPLRDALKAENPTASLAALQTEIEGDDLPAAAGDTDDRNSGADSAHRDILSRVRQLARLFTQNGDAAHEIADKMLHLHELRAEPTRTGCRSDTGSCSRGLLRRAVPPRR